jgi:DNA topoisomerase-3
VLGRVGNEQAVVPSSEGGVRGGGIDFKVSGKEILEPGWRNVYMKEEKTDAPKDEKENAEERTLPNFVKGESGPHTPTPTEKQTTPPPYYTEASLLRAMETAGKFVDDEELRAALKENGIGRPSSRAGIIETLFKRHYIRRERKRLVATPTGIQLIDTIKEELLKSCELTGIWEKKLRDIEHQTYDAAQFVNELKQQITIIVNDVLRDNTPRHIIATDDAAAAAKKPTAAKKTGSKTKKAPTDATASPKPNNNITVGAPCPLCGKGTIIRGRTAYGCSRWNDPTNPCNWRTPL